LGWFEWKDAEAVGEFNKIEQMAENYNMRYEVRVCFLMFLNRSVAHDLPIIENLVDVTDADDITPQPLTQSKQDGLAGIDFAMWKLAEVTRRQVFSAFQCPPRPRVAS
jgi:hypothetical protein